MTDAMQNSRRLIGSWNDTEVCYPQDRCVPQLILDQARATPDACAVVAGAGSLSYRELVGQAGRLAGRLRGHGAGTDSVVGVYGVRCLQLPVALLGVQLAGAGYLPLDPELPAERLAYQAGHAGADVLVTCDAEPPAWFGGTVLEPDLGGSAAGPDGAGAPAGWPLDSLAYVIYTSGSTGRPKGVGVPHRGLLNRLLWMQQAYRLTPADRVLQKTPFGFDVSVWEFFWPLLVGATLVMAEPDGHRDTRYLAGAIREHRISTLHFVPSMLEQFVADPAAAGLTSIRRVICSGEALGPALVARARQLLPGELHNLYGPTEASIDVTAYRCEAADAELATVPIGAPIANTQVHVLDPAGQPVPVGAAGELHLAGAGLARGYLNSPALTAKQFVPNPFGAGRLYRTGDLGRWRPDGQLEYLGRIDHQVKINGNRIELGEIEAVLESLAGIRAAVVTARPVHGRRQLVGYLQPAPGTAAETLEPDRIRRAAAARLPGYMVPVSFVVLAEFPLSHHGKVDRAALPEPQLPAGGRPPATDAERLVQRIWHSVLGVAEAGAEEDFLQLGGDSVLALRVATELRKCRYAISPREVLTRRTIAGIAAALRPSEAEAVPPPDESPAEFPLTATQAGMLFHSTAPGERRTYLLQSVFAAGTADPDRLAGALQCVVDRHEALRTVFDLAAEPAPVQRVLASWQLPVERLDWRRLPPEQEAAEFAELLERDSQAGLPDLAGQPPLRLTIVRLAGDRLRLVLTYHHAILDGWSLALLTDEWQQRYRELGRGTIAAPAPAGRFRDYLAYLGRSDSGPAEQFWAGQLAGIDSMEPLRLAGGDSADPRLGTVTAALPAELLGRLRRLGADRGLTFSSLLHAGWALLLARYGRAEQVMFGCTVTGRPAELPEVADTLGNFINTVPMALRVRGGQRLAEVAEAVQRAALDREGYDLLPLNRIAELSGRTDGSGLFESIVVIANYAQVGNELLRFEHTRSNTGYPLVLDVTENADGARLDLRFQHACCGEQAAGWLLTDLRDILRALAEQPESTVAELGRQGRPGRLAFGPPPPPDAAVSPAVARLRRAATIQQAFHAQAEISPDAVAIRHRDRQVSYRELSERVNRIAHYLLARGIGRDHRVGIALDRNPDLLAAMLGVLTAGAAYVPLPPDLPSARLDVIVEQAGLSLLLAESSLAERLGSVPVATAHLDRMELRDQPGTRPDAPCAGDDLAYIIYTSGSTGRPKGVACHHRGLLNYLAFDAHNWARRPGGAPLLSSVGFDLGVPAIYVPLLTGHAVQILPAQPDPSALIDELLAHGPYSFIKCTPGHLELIAAQAEPAQLAELAGTYLVGGELFSAPLLRRWQQLAPSTRIINEYGPTEASVGNSVWEPGQPTGAGSLPIGTPIDDTTMYFLDPWLNPVPDGMAGELYIGGIAVARGYHDMPAMTASKFLPDPFAAAGSRMYRSGDLGRWNADGDAEFLGRIDTQVKIRGYRVELGEIEAVLEQHPGAEQVAVVERGGRLHAFVSAADPELTTAELANWLSELLPSYLLPSRYHLLEQFPLDGNGKLNRHRLTELAAGQPGGKPASQAGSLPDRLCRIWAEVLGVAEVRPEDNFFELGGDSLLTLKVASAARRHGYAVTPRLLFSHPTVAELVPFVQRAEEGRQRRPVAAGDLPLSPIQRWFFDLELADQHHYNQSVLVEFADLDLARLRTALAAVAAAHEALRLRFSRRPDGWHQRVDEVPAEVPIRSLAAEQDAELVQGSLDPQAGRLLAAGVLPERDGRTRVLIAAHHLGVDTLSWPVLLADLAAAYRGEQLSPPAAGFAAWASALPPAAAAGSAELPAGCNGQARWHRVRLSAELTRQLTQEVPARHRIRVEDVLVSALAQAHRDRLVLDLERHGREEAVTGLDVTDSVGWFTSVHRLDLTPAEQPVHTLLAVKDRLRALAGPGDRVHGGWIVLNYHGRPAELADPRAPFRWLPDTLGPEKSPRQRRTCAIEIEAGLRDGQLELQWCYGEPEVTDEYVHRLAADFLTELTGLLGTLGSQELPATPADFPLVRLTAAELAELAGQVPGPIADIHPLSDLQAGMVLHSLLSPDAAAYTEQHLLELTGQVDEAAFRAAWQRAIDRHAALRSLIFWDLAEGPAAVVLARAALDWRYRPELADPATRPALLAADRAEPFDLAARPALRLTIGRSAPDRLQVVLTFHHCLLDGWSVAVLHREVMADYRRLLRGEPAADHPEPSLHGLVAHRLASRPADEREFWQRELAGLPGGRQLPPDSGTGKGAEVLDRTLDPAGTEAVRRSLGELGITLGTLAHAAWALVLAELTGRDDLVVGSTVSGRSAAWEGIDQAVGMFVNTLPFRVTLARTQRCRDWLAGLQLRHARIRSYEHSALTEIAEWTVPSADGGLFETILAVENVRRSGLADGGSALTEQASTDSTDYPLTALVFEEPALRVRIAYREEFADQAGADRLAGALIQAIRLLTGQPDRELGELLTAAGPLLGGTKADR